MSTPHLPVELKSGIAESFELSSIAKELMEDEIFAKSGRLARTLARGKELTAVVTVVREGTELSEHTSPGAATVTVLFGSVVFSFKETGLTRTLGPGSAVIFSGDASHTVKALKDSAFLIVIGGKKDS